MDNALEMIGLAVFFAVILLMSDSVLLRMFRERERLRHIERIIAQAPEAERVNFIRDYLADPKKLHDKLAEYESPKRA